MLGRLPCRSPQGFSGLENCHYPFHLSFGYTRAEGRFAVTIEVVYTFRGSVAEGERVRERAGWRGKSEKEISRECWLMDSESQLREGESGRDG